MPFCHNILLNITGKSFNCPHGRTLPRWQRYACVVGVPREIMRAMNVDQGMLNDCITRHLGLKWKTAWMWDRRTGRYTNAASPRPRKEPTVSRDRAPHEGDGPSGRHRLPGSAPAAAPVGRVPVGHGRSECRRVGTLRPRLQALLPGTGTLGRTGHHASLRVISLLRLRCRTSWIR
jgi:hypothetical protein